MTRDDLKRLRIPDAPGVYFFKKGKKILYIGKAASLRDRVRSYFAPDLAEGRGARIVKMAEEADSLSWQEAGSVLEALILEANLIKKHQAPYNVDEKDNKSFNYLAITKEPFPRVEVVRGRELALGWKGGEIAHLFGPFPQGGSLHEALRIVRKIFPYRGSACAPCGSKKNPSCKPCFNRQIGLCPGVCTGEVNEREYARAIRNIRDLFSGRFHGLRQRLAREMRAHAGSERFEEAAALRRQIHALDHIRDVSLIKDDARFSTGGASGALTAAARVEAYDVAHTGGSETVAVMAVVEDGKPLKSAYRKFRIRSATNDDPAALREALSRRLSHPEWPLPRVFAVDGGASQLRTAEKLLADAGLGVPIVGVVKNDRHKPERLIGDLRAIRTLEREILLANSEAHRFAISWHRKRLRGRSIGDS